MVQVIPRRLATRDDGLEEEVVFLLGKRHQIDIIVSGYNQNSLSRILRLIRMGQDVEQTAQFDRYYDTLRLPRTARLDYCQN